MPAGSRWLADPTPLQTLPVGTRCWHVHSSRFSPLAANPRSRGRLALVGTHGMFYAADCVAGALWETVLRAGCVSTACYLAYEPPMEEAWWDVAGEPLPLDDRRRGHALVRAELARHGFRWIPLATQATPPGPR